MNIGERLANAAIIEIARQMDGQIGNTGDDDYSDVSADGVLITIDRVALAKALEAVKP